jgi:PilZ domain
MGCHDMRNNIRHGERHPLWGEVHLGSGGHALAGRVVDVSISGVAVVIDRAIDATLPLRATWMCRISARDLPTTLHCLVRIVRFTNLREGARIGCRITTINADDLACLKAYHALAKARRTPLPLSSAAAPGR